MIILMMSSGGLSVTGSGGPPGVPVDIGEPNGTTITILASNPKAAGEFYAVNNHGIFISIDSGVSWKRLDIQWRKEYFSQNPLALALTR